MVPKKIFTPCETSKENFENNISTILEDDVISSEEYKELSQEVEDNSKCLKDLVRDKLHDYSFSSALYEMFLNKGDIWNAKIIAEHMLEFTQDEEQEQEWQKRSQQAYDGTIDELTEEIFPFKK